MKTLLIIALALSLTSCGGVLVTPDNAEGLADLARIIIYNAK